MEVIDCSACVVPPAGMCRPPIVGSMLAPAVVGTIRSIPAGIVPLYLQDPPPRRQEPPSLEGDESPHPLLGEQLYVPYTNGVYPGVATSVVGGAGGRVWVEHPGEKEMFWVERHLLYAFDVAAVTHWEQQKAAAAGKKAANAKKKPNPKPDADPPA